MSSTSRGADVPDGTEGELLARGYNVMVGYFEDDAATAETIDPAGWLKTGDIVVRSQGGYIRVTDRKKDMFIVGGFNVYPAEVEQALLQYPGISQVAVVGVPDARMGEVGVAFVKCVQGQSVDPAELLAWTRTAPGEFQSSSARRDRRGVSYECERQDLEVQASGNARTGEHYNELTARYSHVVCVPIKGGPVGGRLQGKVALVTGAARGQGEAEARLFVREGASVVVADVLDAEGEAVAKDLGAAACYVHLDVTSESDWEAAVAAAVAKFANLDVLVNNAGIVAMAMLADTTLADYRRVIDVNQIGVFLGMRSVIAAMTAAGGGSIVNISSIDGLAGMAGMTSYVASKFAVRGMTKTAALELGPRGIRVNSVHPGLIETPMLHTGAADIDAGLAQVAKRFPVGRIGTADEVAHVSLFLASDESSYCTGTEFVVDGGLMAGVPVPT